MAGLSEAEKPEWNLSSAKIGLISKYLDRGFVYLSKSLKDSAIAFTAFQNIRILINNRLNPGERKEVVALEKKTWNDAGKWKTVYEGYPIPKKKIKFDSLDYKKFRNGVLKYAEHIQDLLRSTGLDIKEKGESGLF